MKSKILFLAACGLLLWSSCGKTEQKSAYDTDLDLKEAGVPIKIKAPKDAKHKADEILGMQDVRVEGTNYYIQIYGTTATTTDRKALINDLIAETKADAQCSYKRAVVEEEFGFVYEKVCKNDTTKFYDFRYVLLRGDKSYTFQTTTTKVPAFTLDQVKEMYAAVRQEAAPAAK